jgi:hypothetical protein
MEAVDYSQFVGRKVELVEKVEKDGELAADEHEGTVEAVNGGFVLFKQKGKATARLVAEADIEEMRFAIEKPKELKQKKLAPVKYGEARQHLVDRHGYKIADINKMTEQQAFEFHNGGGEQPGLDHRELGHRHNDPQAVTEAETSESNSPSE